MEARQVHFSQLSLLSSFYLLPHPQTLTTKTRQAGANLSGDPSKRFEGPTGEGGGGGVRRGQVRRRRGEGIPAAKGADTIFSDGGG